MIFNKYYATVELEVMNLDNSHVCYLRCDKDLTLNIDTIQGIGTLRNIILLYTGSYKECTSIYNTILNMIVVLEEFSTNGVVYLSYFELKDYFIFDKSHKLVLNETKSRLYNVIDSYTELENPELFLRSLIPESRVTYVFQSIRLGDRDDKPELRYSIEKLDVEVGLFDSIVNLYNNPIVGFINFMRVERGIDISDFLVQEKLSSSYPCVSMESDIPNFMWVKFDRYNGLSIDDIIVSNESQDMSDILKRTNIFA